MLLDGKFFAAYPDDRLGLGIIGIGIGIELALHLVVEDKSFNEYQLSVNQQRINVVVRSRSR